MKPPLSIFCSYLFMIVFDYSHTPSIHFASQLYPFDRSGQHPCTPGQYTHAHVDQGQSGGVHTIEEGWKAE